MAAFPDLSVVDLSDASGRDVTEYTNVAFASKSIARAILLFKVGTCLGDVFPDDPVMAELATEGILALAEAMYLAQPFQKTLANPFQSETIGSYSYSKVSGAVLSGVPTGIVLFDLALSKLSVCHLTDGIPNGGGIEAFEHDGVFEDGVLPGNTQLLGPKDIDNLDFGVGFSI